MCVYARVVCMLRGNMFAATKKLYVVSCILSVVVVVDENILFFSILLQLIITESPLYCTLCVCRVQPLLLLLLLPLIAS